MERSSVLQLEPGVRRLLAPNPSPMTYTGTNSYLIGSGEVVLIDPGPDLPAHATAIRDALDPGERISTILVTHSHLDHSPLAPALSSETGAPVLAAGPSDWGQTPLMRTLAAKGGLGGGEGVDRMFQPDRQIGDGDTLDGPWGRIDVLETPGHMANHLSFVWNDALFSGDLVMGWSTSLVSPPDGDMTAFMASLQRLATRQDRIYYPGHGDPVPDPQTRCRDLIAHRKGREAQVLATLESLGAATARDLAEAIYTYIDAKLIPAATRNVMAHLIDLNVRNLVTCTGAITAETRFSRR